MNYLHKVLEEYTKEDLYPMHMPGSKRRNLYPGSSIDVTEVNGLDNLAEPKEIIKELEEGFADYYQSKSCHILVNGSSGGNLAAVYAVKDFGDTIIIGRNCHKSVYNAARLAGLNIEYIYPDLDNNAIAKPIELKTVANAIKDAREKNKRVAAIVLTSPTYEGIITDIGEIHALTYKENIPLIIDAAHGAHIKACQLASKDYTSVNINDCDICIMSLHKTLPTLNQGALLHVNSNLVDAGTVKKAINIFQTTSPSYVIMASMSYTLEFMREKEREFETYIDNLELFYEKTSNLKSFLILKGPNHDPGKIVIICKKEGYDGFDLAKELEKYYRIIVEMSCRQYIIAMTSVCDTKDGFTKLYKALCDIDDRTKNLPDKREKTYALPKLEYVGNDKISRDKEKNVTALDIATEDIYAYPPGSPIIAQGEIISQEAIDFLAEVNNKY